MQLSDKHRVRLYPAHSFLLEAVRQAAGVKYFNPSIRDDRFPRLLEGGATVRTASFPQAFTTQEALQEIQAAGLTAGLFDHWVGLCVDFPRLTTGKPIIALGSKHVFKPDGETRYPVVASNPYWRAFLLLAEDLENGWDPCYDVLVVDPT